MARNWTKWIKGLQNRHEVVVMGRVLSLDRRIIASACMELWSWADDNTKSGFTASFTPDDIDSMLVIPGFAAALAGVGWLEISADGIQFPRWEKHNGKSGTSRALASERQSKTRVTQKSRCDRDKSVTAANGHENHRKTPEETANPPPPDPCAQVVGGVGGGARSSQGEESNGSAPADPERVQVLLVFAHYRKLHPQAHKIPAHAQKEWTLIKARLREGYSVEDLCNAIDGCHRTPHNLGQNDRGQKYLGLELICRNGSQVTRFMEAATSLAPHFSGRTNRTLAAASAYAAQRQTGGSHAVQ